jgi:hypothetical protein
VTEDGFYLSRAHTVSGQNASLPCSRIDCGGCVLSDGRFAAFGGDIMRMVDYMSTETCEALTLDDNERWEAVPPMPEPRAGSHGCASVGRCAIVASGEGLSYRSQTKIRN